MVLDIMLKDHSENNTEHPLPPLKGCFYWLVARDALFVPFYRNGSTYIAFVISVVEHWLDWNYITLNNFFFFF